MFSAVSQHDSTSCCGKTGSKPGLKKALPAVAMPWAQAPAYHRQSDSMSLFPMGRGEENGFCDDAGNVQEPLGPGVPGDKGVRTRRVLGKCCALHPAWALVLAVLMVLVLALAVALAVVSAGRCEGNAGLPVAQVLPCPDDWVGYRNVCYYLSREEGSWEWSRKQCSLRGSSLAVFKRDWEKEFLLRLKGNIDYWLGLRRQGEHLEWVDGSSFNDTMQVQGQEPCLFLNDRDLRSSSCSQNRPYLCSKPQALMGTKGLVAGGERGWH
ncbi:uncharacterized protein [Ciconia boyciana]|uniref:uncharacterized protein isoform X1 n=2 Tax=Ciconia boyciana TaxID=52775 RepID=UPI003B9ED0A7